MKCHRGTAWIVVAVMSCAPLMWPAICTGETTESDIVGIWLIEEDGQPVEKVEVYECGDGYCGRIVWLSSSSADEGPALDDKNKDEDLRSRPLLGIEVMKDFRFDGKDTWRDGKFYAHRKGKTVSPKLTLIDPDHLKIQVKILFVKKSFVWRRVTDTAGDAG